MPGYRKKPLSKHRIKIVDQEALHSVLLELSEGRGLVQDEAGEHLGITQETFSKLLNGKVKSMTFATYSCIVDALGGDASEFRGLSPVLAFSVAPTERSVERRRREIAKQRGAERGTTEDGRRLA